MHTNRQSLIFLITLAITLAVLIDNSHIASADSIEPMRPVCGYAWIDGVIQADEWQLESGYPVTLLGNTGEMAATIYFKYSNDTFYLGVEVEDNELSLTGEWLPGGDAIRIDFDNNTNNIFDLSEDILIVNAGIPHFLDSYLYALPSSSTTDIEAGGTSDGSGAVSRPATRNHFELQHPLCSGDQLDYCLQMGDLLSFRLEYLDAESDGSFGGNYFYPDYSSTVSLLVTDCPVAPRFIYLPLSMR
jgi:hypothetical protein